MSARAFADMYDVQPSGCWIWNGPLNVGGYGYYADTTAQRHSYELHGGDLVAGMHIDHLCRVRACVNPTHLEQVTPKENVLRGEGFAARNVRKTHCSRGHEFTAENTTVRHRARATERRCIACNRERAREFTQRQQAARIGATA